MAVKTESELNTFVVQTFVDNMSQTITEAHIRTWATDLFDTVEDQIPTADLSVSRNLITANLPDNTTQEITGTDLKDVLDQMILDIANGVIAAGGVAP